MKKLISVLLAVLMVLSISVCAFAANSSPAQGGGSAGGNGGGGYAGGAAAPANNDKAEKEAEAAEAEAAAAVEATSVEGEDAGDEAGNEAAAADEGKEAGDIELWLGKKVDEGTEQMKKEWKALLKDLVSAGAKLAKTEASKVVEAVGDKAAVAGAPFRAVASEYPVTVTIKAPADFAGIMAFAGGKWSALDCTVDGSNVTFVLEQPSILSVVTAVATAP